MAAEEKSPQSAEQSLEDAVIEGVLTRNHDDKWGALSGDFAAFVRGTLQKRRELRQLRVSPDEAYSQAIADLGTYLTSLRAAQVSLEELAVLDFPTAS